MTSSTGSLNFCACGNLLESTTDPRATLICEVCGAKTKGTAPHTIVTHSKPDAFPSSLRDRLRTDVREVAEGEIQQDALIDVPCEKCGNPQTRYYTRQLRSADEGSTVFYTCVKCGHKWNVNN
ncbi:hypothetical protein B0A48_04819 [Cryoendolithus antarcticus]|uniref:DNA-directed RNA polymerase subunit n=1 Tax=Cryoendolithus antarcticus TaxID=1507870 RepID=A0A1V8TDU0_9PEZI|nr:hypothetical protein B0A48_04819 [Cryoendolithus antarcticus]